jgi:hypothetical protein
MRYYRFRLVFLFALLTFLLIGVSVIFWNADSTYSAPVVKESKMKTFSLR